MNWIVKAFVQKALSFFPRSHQLNYLIQRYISVGKMLPESFVTDRLQHAQKHILYLNTYGNINPENTHILETGTGWYPLVPVALFLSGFNHIETTDIRRLCNRASLNQTLESFIALHQKKTIESHIPYYCHERIQFLKKALVAKSLEDKLQILRIKLTICDVTDIPITSSSKDLLISNNTLQFLHEDSLPGYFQELKRISKPGSVLSMSVDFTDEYSHFDQSVSPFNFLRYSECSWKLISSPLYRPSRLRYADFRDQFSHRFQIIQEEILRDSAENFSGIKINKMFLKYPHDELRIKLVHFVCLHPIPSDLEKGTDPELPSH